VHDALDHLHDSMKDDPEYDKTREVIQHVQQKLDSGETTFHPTDINLIREALDSHHKSMRDDADESDIKPFFDANVRAQKRFASNPEGINQYTNSSTHHTSDEEARKAEQTHHADLVKAGFRKGPTSSTKVFGKSGSRTEFTKDGSRAVVERGFDRSVKKYGVSKLHLAAAPRNAGGPGSGIVGHVTAHQTAAKLHEAAAKAHILAVRGQARPEDALTASKKAHNATSGAPQERPGIIGLTHSATALSSAGKAVADLHAGILGGQITGDSRNFHEKAAVAHMHAALSHRDEAFNTKQTSPKKLDLIDAYVKASGREWAGGPRGTTKGKSK
jgi:hypothetical protein